MKKRLADLWREWRPRGGAVRLTVLCVAGWILLNAFPLLYIGPAQLDDFYLASLFGVAWARTWISFWPWLFLLLPLLAISFLAWLRRADIITATALGSAGFLAWPGSPLYHAPRELLVFLPAIIALLCCACIVQKIWNTWNAPEPTAEEKEALAAAHRRKWPLRKKILLCLIPLFVYATSSSLCALGGAYRQMAEIAVGSYGARMDYGNRDWHANIRHRKPVSPGSAFTMGSLFASAWRNSDFGPALWGRIPRSLAGLMYTFSNFRRFAFVATFFLLYALWFWRPSWPVYILITLFFLLGVAQAKSDLVWQFLSPLYYHPELRDRAPQLLYFWAKYLPI